MPSDHPWYTRRAARIPAAIVAVAIISIATVAIIARTPWWAYVIDWESLMTQVPRPHWAANSRFTTELPECPHAWDDEKRRSRSTSSAAGWTTDIPEFHDCQRLVTKEASYGPLVAVFAADALDTILGSAPGDLPAGFPRIRAVAEVVNVDGAAYEPLGVQPQSNCLFVWPTEHTVILEAKMVPVGSDYKKCRDLTSVDDILRMPGTRLQVVRVRVDGFKIPSDYPKVARWDWDPESMTQYIGLGCGVYWCEIGQSIAMTYAQHSGPTSPAYMDGRYEYDARTQISTFFPTRAAGTSLTAEDRIRSIKGWYDQQLLAVYDGNVARVSSAFGTVFPSASLDTLTSDGVKGRWARVAYATVADATSDADAAYYAAKSNFFRARRGSSFKEMTALEVCYGRTKDCVGVPDALAAPHRLDRSCGGYWMLVRAKKVERWWVRSVKPDGQAAYFCLTRRGHPAEHAEKVNPPRTARWRWLMLDETEWEECLSGCCEKVMLDDGSADGGDPPPVP
jgi:hypothetical protein